MLTDVTSFVSSSPHHRAVVVPARIVTEAVRCVFDAEAPAPRQPGKPGAEDGFDFDSEFGPDKFGRLPSERSWRVMHVKAPTRSPVNRDLEYRERASLRKKARRYISAFEALIPADIAERILLPDRIDEAHALLAAVTDHRPVREWLTADPDERVTLTDYRPPAPRIRVTPFPGVIATNDGGRINLILRDRDLDQPARIRAPSNSRNVAYH